MTSRFGKRALALAGAAVAVPLLAASIAYACTALATIGLNPAQGDAGTQVQGTGRGFSRATTGVEPVILRFNTRTGQELWRGRPDAGGNISFSFTVPQTAPGSYAIIATQNTADGQAVTGTPARAAFTVTGAPVATAPSTPTAAPQQQPATAPASRPVAQAVPGARSPAGAPAAPVIGQPAVAPASPATPGIAPSTQVGPPSVTPGSPAASPIVNPVAAPVPLGAPAAEERRTVLGAPSQGVALLPLALVAAGVVLTLAAMGLVVARRREEKALAWNRR